MNTQNNQKVMYASFIIMALGLYGILHLNFLPLVFSMILTYLAIETINNQVVKWNANNQAQQNNQNNDEKDTAIRKRMSIITTTGLTLLAGSLLTWGIVELYGFLKVDNLNIMVNKFIQILENLKDNPNIPQAVIQYVPQNFIQIKEQALLWLKTHFMDIGKASKAGITTIVYIIIGFVVGAMLNYHVHSKEHDLAKPLSFHLMLRIKAFKDIFDEVFVAQIKISFINAILTGIYLLLVLPLFNIDIPFKYLLVLITFFVGLIPVVGNLISNTLIIVFSLNISFMVAIVSLLFLVIIHKLEYFLNAKIIGNKINASAWELLLAMMVFEHLFGIAGVIVAPIYYAYVKHELQFAKLI